MEVVGVFPPKWYCAEGGGLGRPAAVDSCAKCNSTVCLGPEAALNNLDAANESQPFVGWNPQGGGVDSRDQSVTLEGSIDNSLAVVAILW